MVGKDVHWHYHVSDGPGRVQHNVFVRKQIVIGIAIVAIAGATKVIEITHVVARWKMRTEHRVQQGPSRFTRNWVDRLHLPHRL